MSRKTFKSKLGDIVITKRRNSRNIKLAVNYSGVVRVSLPLWLPYKAGLHFVNKNERWIKSKLTTYSPKLSYAEQAERLSLLKQTANTIILQRAKVLGDKHGFKPAKLRTRTMTTRWGSCNQKGEITLNVYLAKLPAHLADYVICHELTHLNVFGHQKDFWHELGKIYPDYKNARKQMRAHKPHIDYTVA